MRPVLIDGNGMSRELRILSGPECADDNVNYRAEVFTSSFRIFNEKLRLDLSTPDLDKMGEFRTGKNYVLT